MKKIVLASLMMVCLPYWAMSQSVDDDLYFIPKKKAEKKEEVKQEVKVVVPQKQNTTTVYAAPGSTVVVKDVKGKVRDVDEYNRRYTSRDNNFSMENDTLYIEEKPLNERGEWVNGFEGSQDDYEYAMRIVRFRNPRYAIPVSSPLYWDVVYGLPSWDWNVYDDGLYAYVFPTYTNRLWWDWRWNYPYGASWGFSWGWSSPWYYNSWYYPGYWGGGYWGGYWGYHHHHHHHYYPHYSGHGWGGGEGFVEEIEPRTNCFARPSAANIDQLVIIASAAIPVTDPYLIDRIAAIAALKGCGVLVCLNKTDLDPADELFAIYSQSAIPALRVSAETGEGMDALREQIRGKLSVFTGNSGVGKSSILNCLCPGLSLQVGEVSQALGRGRHTTRHVEMFSVEENTWVIDTPGFSSFDTEELSLELQAHLPETFPEFLPYLGQCRFVGCRHIKEKGCAVLQAVRDGDIPKERHRSYVRLWEEVKDLKPWDKK